MVTGTPTVFTVGATGDNLQFQWQKNFRDLSDGDKYRGTVTDTLQILHVEKDDESHYRCLVKNDVGEMFSDEALLSVSKLLAVIVHELTKIIFSVYM